MRVRVRNVVAEVDKVMVMLEGIGPRKRVKVVNKRVVLPHEVLKVSDIGAVPVPANPLSGFLLRVARYLHTVVEHRVRFVVVLDVKADGVTFARIAHPKEEPLCMPSRINVVLHE